MTLRRRIRAVALSILVIAGYTAAVFLVMLEAGFPPAIAQGAGILAGITSTIVIAVDALISRGGS